jgi:hypothetical protein
MKPDEYATQAELVKMLVKKGKQLLLHIMPILLGNFSMKILHGA